MWPSCFHRHFQTIYYGHKGKLLAVFKARLSKKSQIANRCFLQSLSGKIIEALFEIAHMRAKENKPYNIGKTLIKQCMSKAAGLVLGKT